MKAGRMEKLAEFYNSPGFCDEHSFLFLATDLEPCDSSAQGVEEQHMTIERRPGRRARPDRRRPPHRRQVDHRPLLAREHLNVR